MKDIEKIPVPGMKTPIFVVDDRIEPRASRMLYEDFTRLPYAFTDTDRDPTSPVRHLIHRFDSPSEPLVAPVVELTTSLVEHDLRLRHRGLERVYANFNLFGDFQLAHDDGRCWTVLVYVAAKWEEDWGGETLFYPPKAKWAIAVPPKPGRIVAFDGTLEHRGGVPSKYCLGPRITLAVKYTR